MTLPTTTRRALIAGAPSATMLVALPIAATASEPQPIPEDLYTSEEYAAGRKSAEEVAYLKMARAWIDRWDALGGNFGFVYDRDGSPKQVMRGMIVDTDLWKPTDEGREDLQPHMWLVEEKEHSGALRALEGLLALCPGLREAVHDLGGKRAFARWARGVEA